ncbi:MAG TPA: metallophosphoesterase [Bacteroidales bacterium]|nr:metallophosphoesterase [Bacteroidales bacterium]HOX74029.1 metallophosphoesterase [Bacteroidales bacterium]HPM88472.1 metallophosphoesterase [Bacteroidales bacterium]HQM67995.1 metallophosphoesterase [Bacteroidales bacterium]
MKKIIHLSDLHIGHEDCGNKFRTIIDNIAFLKQPARNYIVVITGDIVDNANDISYTDEAIDSIHLLEKLGYMVLPVPGNHDYGTGTRGDVKFVEIFKERFYKNTGITYPKVDIIEGVIFIGLDSTAEELHWYDRFLSEGELGKEQLQKLEKIINDPDINGLKKVVYLHHHPFDFKLGMQLRDSDELKKLIENKIDALLFGHYHVQPSAAGKIFHGVWGIPRCYNGGTSTHKNGNPGFQRVIDLSNPDPRVDYDGNFI